MCGICGIYNPISGIQHRPRTLDAMIDALVHRGPDGRGRFVDTQAGLGHARLAIIDLTGGHQPLFNEDHSVVLICNGEIYNYRELQRRLIKQGHQLQTGSDCEVILHLWEEYGPECLSMLRGMFAFALYDQKQKLLFGARDRFGQKPFFYRWDVGTFSFASEIKSLLVDGSASRRINWQALDQFLFYQFVPHPHTLFDNIYQLPPAHSFRVDAQGLHLSSYWQNDFVQSPPHQDDSPNLDQLEEVLMDSVSTHMVSDVPVGLFLSGGIDSSLIGALASRINSTPLQSFCIAYPGHRYDESAYADMASRRLGTEHHAFPFQPQDLEETIRKIICHFDQPLADKAVLPLSFLSQKTAQGIKVVLTGDGGDELFAGYAKYVNARRHISNNRWWPHGVSGKLASDQLSACAPDPAGFRRLRVRTALRLNPSWQSHYNKYAWEGWDRYRLYTKDVREALRGSFPSLKNRRQQPESPRPPLHDLLLLDQQSYLPDDLLLKTDYCTMAYGLESRAPFLDHIVAQAAAGLPDHLLVSGNAGKIALRRIAAKYLPPELVQRPKRGFSVPLKRWFRGELKPWLTDLLIHNSTTAGAYFRPQMVRQTLDQHLSGKHNHTQKLLCLVVFELWHRQYGL